MSKQFNMRLRSEETSDGLRFLQGTSLVFRMFGRKFGCADDQWVDLVKVRDAKASQNEQT
jgi:hypothetical protein